MERLKSVNFIPLAEAGDYKEESTIIDYRNQIECINPTYDIQCYYNYLQFLNAYYNNWISFGYLDAGYVPLLMAPSFMHDEVSRVLMPEIKKLPYSLLHVKPISFMSIKSFSASYSDVWIKREDLASILGVPLLEAKPTVFLQKFLM